MRTEPRLYGWLLKYGSFLDPYYNTAPNIQGAPKGTIILTTIHMSCSLNSLKRGIQGII